jgi:hypothetical protein
MANFIAIHQGSLLLHYQYRHVHAIWLYRSHLRMPLTTLKHRVTPVKSSRKQPDTIELKLRILHIMVEAFDIHI